MNPFRLINYICAGIAFLASIAVYIKTIAPTVPFWDGGEFIAASYILGIPHPPGSPLYILLGRLLSFLPVMDVAWRINFGSGLFSALTIVCVYLTIVKAITLGRETTHYSLTDALIIHCSSLSAALMLAFSDTFWFSAVEAEVYSLAMLIMSVSALLTLHWIEKHEQPGSERFLFLIAYLVFLGISVHMFTLLIAPAVFLCAIFTDKSIGGNFKVIGLFAVMGIIMGSIVTSIDPFMVAMPLTILGMVLFKGRIAWGYFILPIVLALIFLFFGVDGVGNYNGNTGLALGGFEVSIGTLLTSVILICISLALISAASEDAARYRWQFWTVTLALAMLGYSVNFYVPIRSAQQPIINENNPSNWKNFENFLERKQYGQESMIIAMFNRKASLTAQFGEGENIGFWGFFSRQFNHPDFPYYLLPVLLLGLGLVTQWERNRPSALFITTIFAICSVGLVLYMNFSDGTRGVQREVRERDYFYTPAFVFAALIMGIGLAAALNQLKDWLSRIRLPGETLPRGFAVLALALPIVPLNYHYTTHSRAGNYIPFDYGYNILQTCDRNAILFTNGDNDTFTLWFLQEVEGIRKDVRVVNLSLLNTDWYIHQLKDQDPRVPISFSDAQIDQISVRLWEDKQMTVAGLSITVPKAGQLPDGRGYIRVQDQMVLDILETNKWKRPMYFAVTVSEDNKVGLSEYLKMEGMAFRFVETKGKRQMDPDRMHKNLWTVYQYRGVADTTVYKDAQTTNLLRNYSAAFQELAIYRLQRGETDAAIKELERYKTLNINGKIDKQIFTQIYAEAMQYDKALPYVGELATEYDSFDGYLILSEAYRRHNLNGKAIELVEKGLKDIPVPEGYEQLARLYFAENDTVKVVETLQRWQKIAPGDSSVTRLLTELTQ